MKSILDRSSKIRSPGSGDLVLDETLKKLEQGILNVRNSDEFCNWLHTVSKFTNYSLNNTLLIAMQNPNATYVAGFKSWQNDFHRQVKKGEKAIRIIAPAPYKRSVRVPELDANGEVLRDALGNERYRIEETIIPAYRVVNVFDISQTEGEPLPQFQLNELQGQVPDYDILWNALVAAAPVPVCLEEISGSAKGFYSLSEKRIVVQKDMSQLQSVKTLIHELSHSILHDTSVLDASPDEAPKSRNQCEVEAESIAFVVSDYFGLDTGDYTFGYVAEWSSGLELPEFRQALETIRFTANDVISRTVSQLNHSKKQSEEIASELKHVNQMSQMHPKCVRKVGHK